MWWKWSAVGSEFCHLRQCGVWKTLCWCVWNTPFYLQNGNVKCWMKFPGGKQRRGSQPLSTSYWSWSNDRWSSVSTTILSVYWAAMLFCRHIWHFTLGIELRACELNQIYKGQRSRNRIVIDFSLYHKLDVATLMSNTLDVSILMIPEGANRAMVTSPSCKVRPLRLHRNHSGSQSVAEENFQGSNIWSSGDGTVCCRLHCWHSRTGQLAHASPAKISPGPIMVGCWCVPNWQDQQNGNSCPSNSSSWKVAT